jgi:predicted HicB family RNase H-like nuclease
MKKDKKPERGQVISTRVPGNMKQAAKRKANREGKNLATWLKDLVGREVSHAAQ